MLGKLKGASVALALAAAALLVAVLVMMQGEGKVSAEEERPAKPTGLAVATEPGSLDVALDWDDVEGADHYLVRWRLAGPGNALNEGVEVNVSSAAIAVEDYDEWVVRVQACNGTGCGKPSSNKFRVEPAPTPTPPRPAGAELAGTSVEQLRLGYKKSS